MLQLVKKCKVKIFHNGFAMAHTDSHIPIKAAASAGEFYSLWADHNPGNSLKTILFIFSSSREMRYNSLHLGLAKDHPLSTLYLP